MIGTGRQAHAMLSGGLLTRAGFTMIEMLIVLGVLALVSGSAIVAYGEVGAKTDEQAIQAECATVRSACLRFNADVGRPPHLIAELLQGPDPTTHRWWWAPTADPVHPWDAAIRRGWNGPYLSAGRSSDAAVTEEARLLSGGGYERRASASGSPLAILASPYGTHPQDRTGGRWRSHIQLEESPTDGLMVRFVHDPAADPPGAGVCRLPTGLKP